MEFKLRNNTVNHANRIVDQINLAINKNGLCGYYTAFLGGSYALKHYYGVLDREIEDLDIILVPSTYTEDSVNEENIKKLVTTLDLCFAANGGLSLDLIGQYPYFDGTEERKKTVEAYFNFKAFTFACKNRIEVNLLMPKHDTEGMFDEIAVYGTPVCPMMNIINAKRRYGRPKDLKDLNDIAVKILEG